MAVLHSDKTLEKLTEYLKAEEGTVYLNDQEEELLKRVLMAHGLFHTGKYGNTEINRIIRQQFSCSYNTALMAMRAAQIILGGVSIYNRRYMAALHLDEVISDIQAARESGNLDLMAKLHATKAKLIELLPSDAPVRDITPAVINFNIFRADVPAPRLSPEQALIKARHFLNLPSTEPSINAGH